MVLTKICIPPQRCLPSPGPIVAGWVGTCGSRAACSVGVWACCPGKCLAGAAEAAPGKGLAGGNCSIPLLLCVLGLGVALIVLCWALASLRLPSFVLLRVVVACGSDCLCTSKGVQSAPLLLYNDRSPRAWATHKRNTLLGLAQNGAWAEGADFTMVILRPLRLPTTRIECVTWRGARDVGDMRGAVSARMRHIVVKRRLAPSP